MEDEFLEALVDKKLYSFNVDYDYERIFLLIIQINHIDFNV